MKISKCNPSSSEAKAKRKFIKSYLDLQFLNKQILTLNYFNLPNVKIPNSSNQISIINAIRRGPSTVISKFSSRILNRACDWVIQFITKPELSADCVSVFFSSDKSMFPFFAASTFPSLFHNFLTEELQKAGYSFITRFINHHDLEMSNALVASFISANPHFFQSLWKQFDEKALPQGNCGDTFLVFLKALQNAVNSLTSYQQDILSILCKKNKKNFGKTIFSKLFLENYIESHRDMSPNPEFHSISKILEFAGVETNSPHFKKIYSALTNVNYHNWIPRLNQTCIDNQTPIILSHHELLLLQRIVQSNHEAFNYPQNEPASLQIPATAENNFECLYFEINLRPYFGVKCNDDFSFMFSEVSESIIEESKSNQMLWEKLSKLARTYNTTELDLFFHPGKVPAAQKYLERIPLKSSKFSNYLTARFRNSMINELRNFDAFISQITIWNYFIEALKARTTDLSGSLSNISRKIANTNIPTPLSSHSSIATPETFKKQSTCKAVVHHKPINPDEACNSYLTPQIMFPSGKLQLIRISSLKISSRNDMPRAQSQISRKHRRRSNNNDKNQVNHDFKHTLNSLVSNCRNNDTKLWFYLRNLDLYSHEDKSVIQLKKKYHELMDGIRSSYQLDKKFHELFGLSFIKRCSKQIDELRYYRRGSALINLADIAISINQVCQYCFGDEPSKLYVKMCSKYMTLCLLLSQNDSVYELFVWYQKLCFCFPDFKPLIPQNTQLAIAFYEALFWQFLKDLDVILFENTKDCCQYLFQ